MRRCLGWVILCACGSEQTPPAPAISGVQPRQIRVNEQRDIQVSFSVPLAWDATVRFSGRSEVRPIRDAWLEQGELRIPLENPMMAEADQLEAQVTTGERPGRYGLVVVDGLGRSARFGPIDVMADSGPPSLTFRVAPNSGNRIAADGCRGDLVLDVDPPTPVRIDSDELGLSLGTTCSNPASSLEVDPEGSRILLSARGREVGQARITARTTTEELGPSDAQVETLFQVIGALGVDLNDPPRAGACGRFQVVRARPSNARWWGDPVDLALKAEGEVTLYADADCLIALPNAPRLRANQAAFVGYFKPQVGPFGIAVSASGYESDAVEAVASGGTVRFRSPSVLGQGLRARIGVEPIASGPGCAFIALVDAQDGFPVWSTPYDPNASSVWVEPPRVGGFRWACLDQDQQTLALSEPVQVELCNRPTRLAPGQPLLGVGTRWAQVGGSVAFSEGELPFDQGIRGGWVGLVDPDSGQVPQVEFLEAEAPPPYHVASADPGTRHAVGVLRDEQGCPISVSARVHWAFAATFLIDSEDLPMAASQPRPVIFPDDTPVVLASNLTLAPQRAIWLGSGPERSSVELQQNAVLRFDGRRVFLNGLSFSGTGGTVVFSDNVEELVVEDVEVLEGVQWLVQAEQATLGPGFRAEGRIRPTLRFEGKEAECVECWFESFDDSLSTDGFVEVTRGGALRIHRSVLRGSGAPWVRLVGVQDAETRVEMLFNRFVALEDQDPISPWFFAPSALELVTVGNVSDGFELASIGTDPNSIPSDVELLASDNLVVTETGDGMWCGQLGFVCDRDSPYDEEGRYETPCSAADRVSPNEPLLGDYDKTGPSDGRARFYRNGYDLGPAEIPLSPGIDCG